jgi:hypothetical protein
MPSLITGTPVGAIRPTIDSAQLSLHDPVNGQWIRFRQHDTIFQDALDDGYSTAVAGWYNPYCRILPEVLDHCFWSYKKDDDNGMFAEATPWANTLGPFLYAASWISPHRAESRYDALLNDAQIADFQVLETAGDRFLADSSINFLLLHIPVPHPGGNLRPAKRRLRRPWPLLHRQSRPRRPLPRPCRSTAPATRRMGLLGRDRYGGPLLAHRANLGANLRLDARGPGSQRGRQVRRSPSLHRQAARPNRSRAHRHPLRRYQHPRPAQGHPPGEASARRRTWPPSCKPRPPPLRSHTDSWQQSSV